MVQMTIDAKDMKTLRTLAARYAEIAQLEVQRERLERYRKTIALEVVRPVVLIDEIPWGEIHDEQLVQTCSPACAPLEGTLRRALYKWDHFQADMVIPPVFTVMKRISSTGIGLKVEETTLNASTGTSIVAHEYTDQLSTEADLEKLKLPVISYNREQTERAMYLATEVFDGLLPVALGGHVPSYHIWDEIARYRGVDSLLMDLVMRPELMHATARRFMEIAAAQFRQYEELDLLDPHPMLLHCTVAETRELPAPDFTGKVRKKDVWGRCSAQIFGSVSPDMHDEFDLQYNQQIFGDCGLLYYGCCEPMDRKIDILRNRFANLRKVSITPWADPERAAAAMGDSLVMAAKPNPAFVSSASFNPKPVEEEMTRYLEACRHHGTPCEFVLKDISTIANRPETLTQWAQTVGRVIDRYFA